MKKNLLVLALLITLTACDFQSLKDPIILTDVEDEFFLDVWEEIRPEGRSFHLLITTIEEQSCSNARIDYSVKRDGGQVMVSLNELVIPEDCSPGQAPAEASIEIGDLSPRYYALRIDLREAIVNKANLQVSPEAFYLDMQTDYGIKPLHTELRRIKNDQFWGYISYPAQLSDVATRLRSDLRDFGNYRLPPNGYYGYFTIGNGKLAIKDQPEHQPFQTLVMDTDLDHADVNRLQNIIAEYRETYGNQGFEAVFRDGKGRIY